MIFFVGADDAHVIIGGGCCGWGGWCAFCRWWWSYRERDVIGNDLWVVKFVVNVLSVVLVAGTGGVRFVAGSVVHRCGVAAPARRMGCIHCFVLAAMNALYEKATFLHKTAQSVHILEVKEWI